MDAKVIKTELIYVCLDRQTSRSINIVGKDDNSFGAPEKAGNRGCVITPGLVWAVPNHLALSSSVYRHLSQNTHPPTLGIVAALAALGRLWVR